MTSYFLANSAPKRFAALIVGSDPAAVQDFGAAVRASGGDALEAGTFEAARDLWAAERPQILITWIRLGAFNGLQLLLRAKADKPDVLAALIADEPDSVLEHDTRQFGGTYFVQPVDPMNVMGVLLAQYRPPLERFEERRTGQRRVTVARDFQPERRGSDRRRGKVD